MKGGLMMRSVALLGLAAMVVLDLVSPKRTNAEERACRQGAVIVASWYGEWHHGKPTKSGEKFDMNALTAASNTIPLGTRVRLTNPITKKSVIVKINDTGGFEKFDRQMDVSRMTAVKLGFLDRGEALLRVCIL
jgi:rare lipoprotein A